MAARESGAARSCTAASITSHRTCSFGVFLFQSAGAPSALAATPILKRIQCCEGEHGSRGFASVARHMRCAALRCLASRVGLLATDSHPHQLVHQLARVWFIPSTGLPL